MTIALRYFFNCLIKIAFLVLIIFLQSLAAKHFASTYDVRILIFVIIGYILIGILIGIDRSLLLRAKSKNIVLDWKRLIFYTIPLFITFIFSSFNVYGFTYRFFAAMKAPFEGVLLIMIGYTIVQSLQAKRDIS